MVTPFSVTPVTVMSVTVIPVTVITVTVIPIPVITVTVIPVMEKAFGATTVAAAHGTCITEPGVLTSLCASLVDVLKQVELQCNPAEGRGDKVPEGRGSRISGRVCMIPVCFTDVFINVCMGLVSVTALKCHHGHMFMFHLVDYTVTFIHTVHGNF